MTDSNCDQTFIIFIFLFGLAGKDTFLPLLPVVFLLLVSTWLLYSTFDLWVSAALFSCVLIPHDTCSWSDLTAYFSTCTQRHFCLCHTNSGPYICFWIFHVETIKGPVYFFSKHSDPHVSALNSSAVSWHHWESPASPLLFSESLKIYLSLKLLLVWVTV